MHYALDMSDAPKSHWPHGAALRGIRGALSMDRASRMVGVTRQTWDGWEKRGVRPSHENLRAIVESFGCPPDLIGFEAPQGWEMVPSEWLVSRHDAADASLAALHGKVDRLLAICDYSPHIDTVQN